MNSISFERTTRKLKCDNCHVKTEEVFRTDLNSYVCKSCSRGIKVDKYHPVSQYVQVKD